MSSQPCTAWRSRLYIPHFDSPQAIQLITFRQADSLPREYLDALKNSLALEKQSLRSSGEYLRRLELEFEMHLNAGYGSCILQNHEAASIIEETLLFFDAVKYRLLAWVVMPNHVHVMIETLEGHPLSSVLHSWKSYTAQEINKLIGKSGRFWQREYFDRLVRNERHFYNAVRYIHNNPVKAGLVGNPEEWRFSSVKLDLHKKSRLGSRRTQRVQNMQ